MSNLINYFSKLRGGIVLVLGFLVFNRVNEIAVVIFSYISKLEDATTHGFFNFFKVAFVFKDINVSNVLVFHISSGFLF